MAIEARAIEGLGNNAQEISNPLIFVPASTILDLKEAMQVVRKEYAKEKYVDPNSASWMTIAGQSLLPGSATFVAKAGSQVVGTLSVIFDSEIGLPIDDLYKEEVDALRAEGKKIAQLAQFAIDRDFFQDRKNKRTATVFMFVQLYKLTFHYCAYEKVDEMVMTINPKHAAFYENAFPSRELGGLKPSPTVNGAPALARAVNVPECMEHYSEYSQMNRICKEIGENPPDYSMFKAVSQELSSPKWERRQSPRQERSSP